MNWPSVTQVVSAMVTGFAIGFACCAVLGLSKADSYKVTIERLGLVIQAANSPRGHIR